MNVRLQVVFRRKDEWVHEFLTHIVEVKRLAGHKTSMSWELIRLAKNGLANSSKGDKFDREALDKMKEP